VCFDQAALAHTLAGNSRPANSSANSPSSTLVKIENETWTVNGTFVPTAASLGPGMAEGGAEKFERNND
jgi:hypothetical protein